MFVSFTKETTMKKFIVIAIAVCLISCAASWSQPQFLSKNFEDGEFKNINEVKFHSLWEMFKFSLNNDVERAVWPEWLETQVDKAPQENVFSNDAKITYINHATFLIQINGLNILTDPVFSERTSPVSFVGPKRIHNPGIVIQNLPKIDIIIISHDHYDHLDLDSISTISKRDKPQIYMGLGVSERLDDESHSIELDWGQSAKLNDNSTLWFLDVQHFSGRTLTDRNTTLWGGYLLDIAGTKIYFGGDSGYADHYQRAYQEHGAVDLAFLPIGAYAPRQLFKPIHMDPHQAVQAHQDLHAKVSIGMHYGTFQLSGEPFDEPKSLLEQAKKDANLTNDSFVTLAIGKPAFLSSLIKKSQ